MRPSLQAQPLKQPRSLKCSARNLWSDMIGLWPLGLAEHERKMVKVIWRFWYFSHGLSWQRAHDLGQSGFQRYPSTAAKEVSEAFFRRSYDGKTVPFRLIRKLSRFIRRLIELDSNISTSAPFSRCARLW